jgi:hypothetical protein
VPLTFDQIQRAAAADDMPADVAAAFLVAGQEYFKAGGRITLEQAIGVAVPSGGDPWYVRLARQRRDQALRLLGEMLVPVGTATDRADAVSRQIRRYREGAWRRRDQHRDTPHSADPIDGLLFAAFRACDGSIPDSPDHLRKLLAA